jgi:predicted dehydrogenase
MKKIGIIGYGGRVRSMFRQLEKFGKEVRIAAITDVRVPEIKAAMKAEGRDPDAIRFYGDADKMLRAEELDGVMIGTRCSLHTPYALKVLKRNLPLFLEKPVSTDYSDWKKLYAASRATRSPVVVSFPLRVTAHVQQALEIVNRGELGKIHHVQAWNNVTYGTCYYMDWYRDQAETQGLFLQKATHDFDYLTYLLGFKPVRVAAMKSKLVYTGGRPAGSACEGCKLDEECPESPFNAYFSLGRTDGIKPSGRRCGFAKDTGNEDSGSALIEYDTGMHVSYSQNFFARRGAGGRGARLFGYKGTLEFDWYTNELKVFYHHAPRSAVIKFEPTAIGHGGGDALLCWNFFQSLQGDAASVSPLSAGLRSALMCLKARDSADTGTFQDIPDAPGLEPDKSRPVSKMYQNAIFKHVL